MVKYILTIIIAAAVGVGVGVWIAGGPGPATHVEEAEAATYRCPMHPTIVTDHPGSCPICGMDLVQDEPVTQAAPAVERQIAYWRAPMDPSFTSDQPGTSPMGMDLIPVYEDELGASGTVQIDPVTVQNIGVKTARVERQQLTRKVRTVGRVDYDETGMTDVNTKMAGWVEKLHVDYTGQVVEKGQPLLEIYSPELVAAQEEYLTALDYQLRLERSASGEVAQGGRDLLSAAGQRLRYWDITERQIAELEESGQVKRTMTVYSPQEGIVVHKAVFDGAHIKSGEHLYRIGNLSRVWVYADVYEYELPWVKVGQEAEVELSYLPGKVFRGRVTYIYPFLEPQTRTVKVRMSFDNPELELKPEMYANVSIRSMVSRDALVVPVQSVIRSGERNIVVADLGDGKFQPREVELGVESDGLYQVLEGVRQGDTIVTSAHFLIDSESNLKAAVSGMSSAPPAVGGREAHQPEDRRDAESHEGHPTEPEGTDEAHQGHQLEESGPDEMKDMEHAGHQDQDAPKNPDSAHASH